MKMSFKNFIGCILILIGLMVIAFSSQIVFPGLERLIGIETIVGKANVVYEADGSYLFTNPGAMVKWIASVAVIGMLISIVGVWLSGMRLKFPNKSRDTLK
jgi:hypothetical protein